MGRFPTVASAAWLSPVSSELESTWRNLTTLPALMTCKNVFSKGITNGLHVVFSM